jgi:bifunctional enzyme Fae/Hps
VQSAVGKAIADAVEEEIIPNEVIETFAVIVKVFVHPAVVNRRLLYMNTYDGVKLALLKAFGLWRKK